MITFFLSSSFILSVTVFGAKFNFFEMSKIEILELGAISFSILASFWSKSLTIGSVIKMYSSKFCFLSKKYALGKYETFVKIVSHLLSVKFTYLLSNTFQKSFISFIVLVKIHIPISYSPSIETIQVTIFWLFRYSTISSS